MESKSRKILFAAIISTLYCGAALANSSDNGVAAPEASGPVTQALPALTPLPPETNGFKSDARGTSR